MSSKIKLLYTGMPAALLAALLAACTGMGGGTATPASGERNSGAPGSMDSSSGSVMGSGSSGNSSSASNGAGSGAGTTAGAANTGSAGSAGRMDMADDSGRAGINSGMNSGVNSGVNIGSATVLSIENMASGMGQAGSERQTGSSGTSGSAGSGTVSGNMLYRVTLRLDDGSTRTLMQASRPAVQVGERVSVQGGVLQRR